MPDVELPEGAPHPSAHEVWWDEVKDELETSLKESGLSDDQIEQTLLWAHRFSRIGWVAALAHKITRDRIELFLESEGKILFDRVDDPSGSSNETSDASSEDEG